MHLTLVSAPLPVDASPSLCPIFLVLPPWPPLLMPKRFLCPRGSRGTATAVPVEVPRADALVRWTRLPVAGEYKSRLKRQKAAASRFVLSCSTVRPFPVACPSHHVADTARCHRLHHRLSQLPPIEKAFEKAQRSQTSLGFSRTGRVDRWEKLALEKFNPWSPHQTALRNYAAVYGMQKKPDRFDSNAMLAMTGGLTDLRA